jgi:hypothetical protein
MAALADNLLTDILAISNAGSEELATATHFTKASGLVRHWGARERKKATQMIKDLPETLRSAVTECLERFGALKERRNRAIHDAVDLGWDGENNRLLALAIGYPKVAGETAFRIERVTPDVIADLACEYDELRADLEHCRYMLLRPV